MAIYSPEKDDLRWLKGGDSDERITYLDTLKDMCKYYGTFCGRWHDNEFWAKTLKESESMTEEEAKQKVFEIENDAETELAYWKAYQ